LPADENNLTGRLVVITGPSGAGKSTIVKAARERTGALYSVSCTTRPPRPGEVDGRDYRFVSREEFGRMIQADELLEWAEVFGNFYGTPAAPVSDAMREGKTVLLEIDIQGGLQVARRAPRATFVLIVPPDDAELRRRLVGRGTESQEVIERRLAKARQEIATARQSGSYTHTVVNDDLERAIQEMVAIIQEHRKT
jgi:guanylate kinase